MEAYGINWKVFKKRSTGHHSILHLMLIVSLLSAMASQYSDAPAGDPKSSLESRTPAKSTPPSKGWRKRESEGVGLGIVAALEKGPREKCSVVVGAAANLHLTTAPIAIGSARSAIGCAGSFLDAGAASQLSCCGERRRKEIADSRPSSRAVPVAEELEGFREADFLSCCNLCRKSLHGRDVYMYRGEMAFCSTECRYQQIVSDERQEKRGARVRNPTSTEIPSSPCSDDRLFFTGIVVT